MNLNFIGGPVDGHSVYCSFEPPPVFFLPSENPLIVSVYLFDSVISGVLQYTFAGYRPLESCQIPTLVDTVHGDKFEASI